VLPAITTEGISLKPLIIAEAGVNHNGDLGLARQLVDAAAEAGADLVKFQTFSADRLVSSNAAKAEYQVRATGTSESQHAMLKELELTRDMHVALIEQCRLRGIGFFSTAFDIESLDFLAGLGLDLFKIPSGELTNLPYLRHVAGLGKPLILSSGMANLQEIEAALNVCELAGAPRNRITVLHCNTDYPTPLSDVNLRAMQTLRDSFGVEVGYSDHTAGIEVAIAAAALGATVIEKHFTLSRDMKGPDHKASLEPEELKTMVTAIRNVCIALGTGIKQPSSSELKNIACSRKSVVAARPILRGEIFSADNLTTKRPGTGLSPMRWDEIVGKAAPRNFLVDELIEI
jgi:N,N'-diacetyllegionaminate synthase